VDRLGLRHAADLLGQLPHLVLELLDLVGLILSLLGGQRREGKLHGGGHLIVTFGVASPTPCHRLTCSP
jgi:hypothetical protein